MSRRIEDGGADPRVAACAGTFAACGFAAFLISLTQPVEALPEARGVSRRGGTSDAATRIDIEREIDRTSIADAAVPTADASGSRGERETESDNSPGIDPALAVGTWTREATGLRTLTIRPDGTATLHIAFDWLTALAMGPEVTLSIRWSFSGGEASFETVGGEPEATFRVIAENYGTSRRRPVAELTAERFVLGPTGPDDDPVVWTRVEPPEKGLSRGPAYRPAAGRGA